ncbi:CopM family metallochaperone [Roseinatronobacter sp.]
MASKTQVLTGVLAFVAGGVLVTGISFASSHMGHGTHGGHGGHDAHAGHEMAPAPDGASAATLAYIAANAAMHEDMDIEFTGNADADFILGMIPHHEGAVAMAEIVLEYGEDPEVAELAREIIAAQEQEIGWMRDWLARQGL